MTAAAAAAEHPPAFGPEDADELTKAPGGASRGERKGRGTGPVGDRARSQAGRRSSPGTTSPRTARNMPTSADARTESARCRRGAGRRSRSGRHTIRWTVRPWMRCSSQAAQLADPSATLPDLRAGHAGPGPAARRLGAGRAHLGRRRGAGVAARPPGQRSRARRLRAALAGAGRVADHGSQSETPAMRSLGRGRI